MDVPDDIIYIMVVDHNNCNDIKDNKDNHNDASTITSITINVAAADIAAATTTQ